MPRRFPIFQLPNRPLIVAAVARALASGTPRRYSSLARLVSDLAMLVWALEEAASGANWFRRMLGFGGTGYAIRRAYFSASRASSSRGGHEQTAA